MRVEKENMMDKKWKFSLVIVLTLMIGLVGGMYGTSLQSEKAAQEEDRSVRDGADWDKMEKAYSLILNQYVEKVDGNRLIEGAIQGMVATLKDPYSVYMDKEMAQQFNETLDSSFEGIGTEIGMEDGKVIIVSPYKDSPAEKAGLKPKDEILKVNGESVKGLDLYETRLKIRGKKGTTVTLEINRPGISKPITFKIERAEIPLDTVFSSIKNEAGKNIGYIELTSFSENTARDFKEQLSKLESEGIKGLVIDVRGNPGGLLSSVQSIVSQFITKDHPFLKIEERTGKIQSFYTDLEKEKDYPIVVLIDGGSASASEILAGALHEAGQYPLIGEKTFGKGTVQQAVEMGDGSNIKLTLYKWLTPDGHWIHQKGIDPTLQVHQPSFFTVHPLNVEKTLEPDMNDEQIKYAQAILKGLGFEPGREDGYYDEQTELAVRAFQKVQGLEVTGKVDTKTAQQLESRILEKIKDQKNDVQLLTAIQYVARSTNSR